MYARLNSSSFRGALFAAAATFALSTGAFAAGEHGGGQGSSGHGSTGAMMPKAGHGDSHGGGHGNAAGEPGRASDASRTLTIELTDNRYSPEAITVTAGETIRFVIVNKGELVHEFNIGTPAMHKVHQKEMMMMVEHGVLEADKINHDKMKMDMGGGKTMEHNDPNSALLEPGKSAKIVWKFSNAGTFEFACNVPGH